MGSFPVEKAVCPSIFSKAEKLEQQNTQAGDSTGQPDSLPFEGHCAKVAVSSLHDWFGR